MRQTQLIKTNQGVKFWLKNDRNSIYYIRGEFVLKEQGFRVYRNGDRTKEKIFSKDKKIWIKF